MFLLRGLGLVSDEKGSHNSHEQTEEFGYGEYEDIDGSSQAGIKRETNFTWGSYPPLIQNKLAPICDALQNNPVRQVSFYGATTPNPIFSDQLSIGLHSLTSEHKLQLLDGITPPKFASCYGCWELGNVLGLMVIAKEDEPKEIHKVLDFLSVKHCKTDFASNPRDSDGVPQEMFMGIYKMVVSGTGTQSVFLVMGSPQGCASLDAKRHSRKGRGPGDRELTDDLVVDICMAKHFLERRMETVAFKIISDMIETFLAPADRVHAWASLSSRITIHDTYSMSSMEEVNVMGLSPTYFADIDQVTTMAFSSGVINPSFSTERFPVMCHSPILGMNIVSMVAQEGGSGKVNSAEARCIPSCIIDYDSKKRQKDISIPKWRLGNVSHFQDPEHMTPGQFLELGKADPDPKYHDYWLCPNPHFDPSTALPLVKHGVLMPIVFCAPVPEHQRS